MFAYMSKSQTAKDPLNLLEATPRDVMRITAASLCSSSAQGADAITYAYVAKGRLVKVVRTGAWRCRRCHTPKFDG